MSSPADLPAAFIVPSPSQYYLFLSFSACLLLVLIPLTVTVSLRMRRLPNAENLKALRWYLCSSIAYLIVNSLEVLAPTEASTLSFMKLCYLFVTGIPIWLFLFSLSITGRNPFSRKTPVLQWAFPVVVFLIAFTNERHHLNWGQLVAFRTGPFLAIRALSYGPWFWFVWISMQILVVVGFTLILFFVFSHERKVNYLSFMVVLGALVPIGVNGVYVLRIVPGWQKDFSAVAFASSGILFAAGVLRTRLFDLVPIARRKLVEALSDPLVVVDEDGVIVDANPAALRVCGLGDAPVGKNVDDSPFFATVVTRLVSDRGNASTADVSPDGKTWYEVRVTEIPSWGDREFRAYALRDITESRRLMEEKSALVERLSSALSEIRTLEGIVPICASCKKIRDDTGYWQQVDSYVASRTNAEFSRGLCPNCRERLRSGNDDGISPDHEEIDSGGRQ